MRKITGAAVLLIALAAPTWANTIACKDAFYRNDYETAVKSCRPLAEQGYASAQTYLGVMYYTGRGVPQDYAEGVRWWNS